MKGRQLEKERDGMSKVKKKGKKAIRVEKC